MSVFVPESLFDGMKNRGLVLREKRRKKPQKGPPKTLRAYEKIPGKGYRVPFSWYMQRTKKLPNRARKEETACSERREFTGTLYGHQVDIMDRARTTLKKHKSCLLALHTGAGKCFARGTEFRRADGSVVRVEDIVAGEHLLGDDGAPREVTALGRGVSPLYRVHQERGCDYVVNEGHILSLVVYPSSAEVRSRGDGVAEVTWFDERLQIHAKRLDCRGRDWAQFADSVLRKLDLRGSRLDIPVERYLDLPTFVKQRLYGYSVGSGYPLSGEEEWSHEWDSRSRVPLAIFRAEGAESRRRFLKSALEPRGDGGGFRIRGLSSAAMRDLRVLCRSVGVVHGESARAGELVVGSLYANLLEPLPEKIDISRECDAGEYFGFTVLPGAGRSRRVLLKDHTVVHNTTLSVALACDIGLRACVILPRQVLFSQWEETVRNRSNLSVQTVTTKNFLLDPECDVYLMSPHTACNVPVQELHKVGLLICDEAHMLCTPGYSRLFFRFSPLLVLGATATPNRPDGFEQLLWRVFGDRDETTISKPLQYPHRVLCLRTGFVPEVAENARGELDWSVVLASQCGDEGRNLAIARMVEGLVVSEGRSVLVLCKRLVQVGILVEMLQQFLPDSHMVDRFTGKEKTFCYDSDVLVSSYSKSGVGFDFPKLDTLVIASDVESFIAQYHGRIFRRRDVNPLVVDIVDDFHVFRRHWNTRRKYYESCSARVEYQEMRWKSQEERDEPPKGPAAPGTKEEHHEDTGH